MFEKLNIFQMASAMASHAGRRQALVAQNMANVDTPGFQAKRLKSFADITTIPNDNSAMRSTRSGHLQSTGADQSQARIFLETNDPAPDGNTVSVEREMLEAISVKREHDRSIAIYKSSLKILQSTLARA